MSLFLSITPLEEARVVANGLARSLRAENVSLTTALGRVLAADVVATEDIPSFSRSVVDGFAVIAGDTVGAAEAMPAMLRLSGRVAMGRISEITVGTGECAYVPTGGTLPKGADAMVMVEHTEEVGEMVLVFAPAATGDHVVARGEDFARGSVVLNTGRRLSPRDLGVLAAIGLSEVAVRAAPVVGIISTGNELVEVDAVPGQGQVRDANSSLCAGFVEERGCVPVRLGIIPDERERLEEAIRTAAEGCDLVLVSGGSSKDERDMCASVLEEIGQVHVHGIGIAPGKPTIIGEVGGIPVIGLPGHPASAYVVLIALVGGVIAAMTGETETVRTLRATLTGHIPSAKGRTDYIRVRVQGGMATPLFGKSGLLNTLSESSGVVAVPAAREGFEAGEEVEVILW